MSLTILETATSSTATAAKSINVKVNSSASAVMYTVPSGRKFKGHLWTNANTYFGVINGVQMRHPYGHTSYQKPMLSIELTAGDVVNSSPTTSDYTHLQGLESDA